MSDSEENLTIDAVPEGKSQQYTPKPQIPKEQSTKTKEKADNSPPPTFKAKPKANAKPKSANKASQKLVQYNISNASNVHIGSNYVVNVNKSGENLKTNQQNQEMQKTDAVDDLMLCKDEVTKEIMMFASTHIGKGWKDMARRLDLSDGQIDQFYEMHIKTGLKEVIYQILLDWTQVNPEEATIGLLATTLWDCSERDAVVRLAKEFNNRS